MEIEQGRHRRVPRADRCCPIEGCGRLVEDEGHLMECPLYFNPRITLGLNAHFDMTMMKEVFTPSCRVGWRALAALLRECKRVRMRVLA